MHVKSVSHAVQTTHVCGAKPRVDREPVPSVPDQRFSREFDQVVGGASKATSQPLQGTSTWR